MKTYRHDVALGVGVFILLFVIGNWCPVEQIIGIPCPGCNMFSALYWLCIKGNIQNALYFHPAVFALLGYVIISGVLYVKHRQEVVHNNIFKVCSIVFIVLLVIVYVYRMIDVFPNMPMGFHEDALLPSIFHLL